MTQAVEDWRMDDAVRDYIAGIAPEHRPLFDRLHQLILETRPDATISISYRIPTFRVGRRRLFVGVWKHGVSIYGWRQGGDGGLTARHPELKAMKGTIQLRSDQASRISDEELRELVRATLGG